MFWGSFYWYIFQLFACKVGAFSQFSKPLDNNGLHTLYWTVDYNSQTISMKLYSKVPIGSWMALGFSDRGDLSNADLCMVSIDSLNTSNPQDVWTDEKGVIHIDDQQDCIHQSHKLENNSSVFTFTRKFDTCDIYDKIIEEGTMHVVWAVGTGPVHSLKALDMSAAQHGSVSTWLLRPSFADPPLTADIVSLDVLQQNFNVPKTDVFWCKIVRLPDTFKQKHHIVRYDTVLTPGNELLVHHVLLRECESLTSLSEGSCDLGFRNPCIRLLATGMANFTFPEEAGFALGGPNSTMFVMLEVHYTPYDKKEWVDNSGIRLYVTPKLRQYDSDMMEFGSMNDGVYALPPGQPRFPFISHCVTACTAISLPADGITMFATILHAHGSALGMVLRHVRAGKELPEIVRDNHYDVHNQESRLLRQPVKVLPGDELITTCWFDTTRTSNVTMMGSQTSDEMCLIAAYYYPTISLTNCKSTIHQPHLDNYFCEQNGIHNSHEENEEAPYEKCENNFMNISWTLEQVKNLQQLYGRSTIDAHCYWKDVANETAPGNWSNLPVVSVLNPLPQSSRPCRV